jgi:hypothetical protein
MTIKLKRVYEKPERGDGTQHQADGGELRQNAKDHSQTARDLSRLASEKFFYLPNASQATHF